MKRKTRHFHADGELFLTPDQHLLRLGYGNAAAEDVRQTAEGVYNGLVRVL